MHLNRPGYLRTAPRGRPSARGNSAQGRFTRGHLKSNTYEQWSSGLGRHRKPDALTNAEHQRRHAARHKLVTVKVVPEVAAALAAARTRLGLTTNSILLAALNALQSAELSASRDAAKLRDGSQAHRPRKSSGKANSSPGQPDLFGGVEALGSGRVAGSADVSATINLSV